MRRLILFFIVLPVLVVAVAAQGAAPRPTSGFTLSPSPLFVGSALTATPQTTCGASPCSYVWTVKLAVTDAQGRTTSTTKTVTAAAPTPPAPPPTTTTTPPPPPPPTTTTTTTPPPAGGSHCFSSPGACGYPDPAFGNVGHADCSTLPTVTPSNIGGLLPDGSYYYSGSGNFLEVISSNVTWAHLNFANWQIYDSAGANNFTLNDDCVSYAGAGDAEEDVVHEAAGNTGLTITNSTINGANATSQSANGLESGDGTTISNVLMFNVADGINIGDGSITDSYILSNANAHLAHIEPVYTGDNTLTIHHDVLLNPEDQAATIFADTSAACASHLTITNNLLAGGGYMLYACSPSTSRGSSTLNVTGNDFARCAGSSSYDAALGGTYCGSSPPANTDGTSIGAGADTSGYWPGGGFYGIDAYTFCAGSTWSGNVWDDDGSAVNC